MRYLMAGLLVEGASDETFLKSIVGRQLAAFGDQSGFEVGELQLSQVRTVWEPSSVDQALNELADTCHIVVVHHDRHEASKIDALMRRQAHCAGQVVSLVPVRETEAWILGALAGLAIPGTSPEAIPRPLARLENEQNPRALLRKVLGRRTPERVLGSIGDDADLTALRTIPAYQAFHDELIAVLKELRFL
jgi:hypothetical protein